MKLKDTMFICVYIFLFFSLEREVDGQGHNYDNSVADKARDTPFCISPSDPSLVSHQDIMFKEWIPILQSKTLNPKHVRLAVHNAPTKYLKWIQFSKIRLNGASYTKGNNLKFIDEDKILAGNTELKQWMHIMILGNQPLEGLYIQAIHGPVGIPIGQFTGFEYFLAGGGRMRSRCQSCANTVDGFKAFPCSARSKANLRHPNVYLFHHQYDGPNTAPIEGPKTHTEIHANFNFVDVICSRVTAIQFLIVAVKSFQKKEFEVVKSDVFSPPRTGDFDGVPYPFHPDFALHIICMDYTGTYTGDDFKILQDKVAPIPDDLRYNVEYDECIRLKVTAADFKNTECPPGPFKCAMSQVTAQDEEISESKFHADPPCTCPRDIVHAFTTDGSVTDFPIELPDVTGFFDNKIMSPRYEDDYDDDGVSKSPIIDTGTVTGNGTGDLKLLKVIRERAILTQLSIFLLQFGGYGPGNSGMAGVVKNYHGQIMFFAWSISLSIATFSSRFFKEACIGADCGGKGLWFWCHVFFTFVSFLAMWTGAIFTLLTKSETDSAYFTTNAVHSFLGFIAVGLFHFNFFAGWFRPVNKKMRIVYIVIHLFCGYGSKLVAMIAMCYSTLNYRINTLVVVIAVLIEVINLILYGIGWVSMFAVDSRMKESAPHRVCPVPEQREEIEKVKYGCCGCCLGFLLPIHIALHLVFFAFALFVWHSPIIRSYGDIIIQA